MSIVRDILSEKERFIFDNAVNVLNSYVELLSGSPAEGLMPMIEELMSSAAAEIALFDYLAPDKPSLPTDLAGAKIEVTREIAILTTRIYLCSPTRDCPKKMVVSLTPENFTWAEVVLFTGDANKADVIWSAGWEKPLSALRDYFPDFTKKFLDLEESWIHWAIGQYVHKDNVGLVRRVQAALWRTRVDIIFGVTDKKELLQNYEEILGLK